MKGNRMAGSMFARMLRTTNARELAECFSSEDSAGIGCLMKAHMIKESMRSGLVATAVDHSVQRLKGVTLDMVRAWISGQGGDVVYVKRNRGRHPEHDWYLLVTWRGMAGEISSYTRHASYRRMQRNRVTIHRAAPEITVDFLFVGTDPHTQAMVREIERFLGRHRMRTQRPDPIRRRVHMLSATHRGLSLRAVASIEDPLERGNYTPGVLDDFDHVVDDLSAADPCGRLVIVHGPPGTGKTYLVRGMIEAARDVRFVLVPSQMIARLSDPGLADLLIRQKKAVCLVVEDADMLLAERGTDNMSSISSLLNLADGIFGKMANVRIICTTNAGADRLKIDQAMDRSMRLCREIQVPPLDLQQADGIFRRITDGREPPALRPGLVLADIYKLARGDGLGRRPRGARPTGFDVGPVDARRTA